MGDTYNYNKMGIYLGIGKKKKVITALKAFRIISAKDINYELTIVVEVISGDRVVGLLFIILTGKII